MLVSGTIGICLSGLGYKFLTMLVDYGWPKTWANLVLALPMAGLGFVVHKLITWRDRDFKVVTGVRRWSTTRLTLGIVSQLTFLLMVGAFGLPISFVRGGTVAVLALPTYAASNGWAFKNQEDPEKV
jgi:hypothetical protein